MPASRKARATILTPRSWPSSPILARTTRIGAGGVGMRLASWTFGDMNAVCFFRGTCLFFNTFSPLGRALVAAEHICEGLHDFADRATGAGGLEQRRQHI